MMTPVAHLSLVQARRLALRSLAPELQSHSVLEVIQRLGYVQIDTIAVIERAHHHVLWTRLPTYDTSSEDDHGSVNCVPMFHCHDVGSLES